jgi:hypothetical protein
MRGTEHYSVFALLLQVTEFTGRGNENDRRENEDGRDTELSGNLSRKTLSSIYVPLQKC